MEMKDLFKQHTEVVESRLGELGINVNEIKARLDEVEQKAVRRGGDEPAGESWGTQFAKNVAQLEEVADASTRGRRANFSLEMKTTLTTGTTSAGPLGLQPFRDGVVAMPRRVPRVRDLLPVVGISSGSVEYPRQTTRTNNAGMVAEAAEKPESAYGFEMVTATPKVIAHWIPASRQILEDSPQLAGIIDSELLYGLALKEDEQLLSGDGTGQNLTGLITTATAYSAPFDPAGTETMIDTIALAILQNTLADYAPSGIVMHPSDWMRMRLLKDGDGKYLLGDPGAQVEPRLFGLPVVPTTAMTIDKFLVGDFNAAGTIYDRWTPRIEVATEHADFFVRNMVAILAEERLALAIKQAGATIYGDFGNVA
jgi:HK97 family phage major capsid protein